MQDVSDEDRDEIVVEAAAGRPLRSIAKERNISRAAVTAVLDAAAEQAFSGEQLRRDWFLEAFRLRNVIETHYRKHTDPTSAVVMIKASERLASLLGLNAAQSYSVQLAVSSAEPKDQQLTSTEKLLEAIRLLRADGKKPDDEEPQLAS